MLITLVLVVLLTGMALAAQPVINAFVADRSGYALSAAFISVTVTFVALLVASLAMRAPLPSPRLLASLPPWVYAGGLIGAVFLVVSLIAAPRMGAATTMALLIAGQLLCALVLDHLGWLGIPERPISFLRLLGAICLLLGVVLIRRF